MKVHVCISSIFIYVLYLKSKQYMFSLVSFFGINSCLIVYVDVDMDP